MVEKTSGRMEERKEQVSQIKLHDYEKVRAKMFRRDEILCSGDFFGIILEREVLSVGKDLEE
jgi:hypothetical protein